MTNKVFMIEIFKTNVQHQDHATAITTIIQSSYQNCFVNFDLDDCDKVMRVKIHHGEINVEVVIALLDRLGFEAQVLPDVVLSDQIATQSTI